MIAYEKPYTCILEYWRTGTSSWWLCIWVGPKGPKGLKLNRRQPLCIFVVWMYMYHIHSNRSMHPIRIMEALFCETCHGLSNIVKNIFLQCDFKVGVTLRGMVQYNYDF